MTGSAGPVVIGVSRRTGSPAALRWGIDYARRTDAAVVAVMAFHVPRAPATTGARPPVVSPLSDDPQAAADQRLADFVAAVVADPEFEDSGALRTSIGTRAVQGNATAVLLAAAAEAQLLVLDAPRANPIGAVRTGLVAPRLMFESPCPVVAMPAARGGAGRALSRVASATARAAATAGRPGLRTPPVR